jgi:hypothetical protein
MADPQELKAEAENCRRFAQEADGLTMRLLLELSEQYEAEARLQLAYPRRLIEPDPVTVPPFVWCEN